MRNYDYEEELLALGVAPERPHALLAAPLVAVARADGAMTGAERAGIAQFCTEELGLGFSQMETVQRWLDGETTPAFPVQTAALLAKLCDRSDAIGIDNMVLFHVLTRAEALLRRRIEAAPTSQGRAALTSIAKMLGIDLGEPWEKLAPEQFETAGASTQSTQSPVTEQDAAQRDAAQRDRGSKDSGAPIRRHLAKKRLARDDLERGGLV